DVSLDYISRYETANAALLVDRIEGIVTETGESGFHFVDEAAPPKALKALAQELLRRGRTISWWGNIRFEKSFSPEVCQLLARSGCIAITLAKHLPKATITAVDRSEAALEIARRNAQTHGVADRID
ncbi:MAG: methyltransferase, partial [Pirellulaceae bacterium]